MEKDQKDLLYVFNDRNVRYLVVGGYAFSHYTEPRATKDLDLFVDPSEENSRALFAALAAYGAPLSGMTPADFQQPDAVYQIGLPPSRIDILQHIDGVTFESAWQASIEGDIGDTIPVRYISVEHLIQNKLSVGRLRDLADVEDIRNALAARSRPTEE
jgi:hypothetical protein